MIVIEPHIHMYSRTTDDYQAMYAAGIRACVEPSFWLGSDRRYAGTFFDYFRVILDFETIRARRFGIDHFACISVNPKECEDPRLVDDVLAGIGEYLDHPRCVADGEIGLNLQTPNEERALHLQLDIAKERELPVIIHLPHTDKLRGALRIIDVLHEHDMDSPSVILDHNTEDTMPAARKTSCYAGMTVYPISKLTPERVSGIIRRFGSERMIVNGSADWGISDPLSLVKVVSYFTEHGHPQSVIADLVFNNADAFYRQSPRWKPELDLAPVDPRQFQR